jgi:two-component system, OmpR family, response regulator QseB
VPKVLLVEDDPSLAKLVRFTLEAERCVTDHVTNSASAIIAMKNEEYDILILDWSLPDGTGLDLCKHYRSMGGTKPIMMLTARHASVDKVAALSAGADDYVVKPFDPDELAARIKALLRRPPLMMDSILRVGAIELDKVNFWVKKGGNPIALQPKEFAILQLLMEHPDRYFTAEAILARVWRSDLPVSTDSVRTHVKSLRKKLGDVIDSSRGLGYRMNAEAQ